MKRNKFFCMLALLAALLLTKTIAMSEVIHVDKTIESAYITLKLNADVDCPEKDSSITIYKTDYPVLDVSNWANMFSIDESGVKCDGKSISFDNNAFFAKYFPDEARLAVRYSPKDYFVDWPFSQVNYQATGLVTTPEEAKNLAQEWIAQLSTTLGWDEFVFSACYSMPSEAEWYTNIGIPELQRKDVCLSGCYIVEFIKKLGDYSIAYDQSPYLDDTMFSYTKGDHIQVYIDDDGIGYIEGYCRSYIPYEISTLQITLDEAIDILQENMDYVACYPTEMPCEIKEINLCYRLVQKLPVSDEKAAVQMEARPAWRFATSINRWDQQTFFLFVDAVTGEVLP